MSTYADLKAEIAVTGSNGLEAVRDLQSRRFALGVGDHVDLRKYTVAAATYQAFTVPTGARLMVLYLGDAVSVTFKGDTADVGVTIAPATLPLGLDLIIPLGASPTPGILNGHTDSQTVYVGFY